MNGKLLCPGKRLGLLILVVALVFPFTGCSQSSYPSDKLKESLLKICSTEYGVEDIDVKIVGTTIGVYLPLKKLFNSNLKDMLASGKVKNVDSLFEPSPEAMDKVEDVLFSISRVILSTDKPLEFYVLQATDVGNTGLQIVLKGYVEDIKRVRYWDISRSEYRKRVIHELQLNQTVLWHRPVRQFFRFMHKWPADKLISKYFNRRMKPEILQQFFFDYDKSTAKIPGGKPADWQLLDIRSIELDMQSAAVYVKVRPGTELKNEKGEELLLEYLFLVGLRNEKARITRVIPFQYQTSDGKVQKIAFPKELQLEDNLSKWKEEFVLEPIDLGSFLAQQMTRRMQFLLAADERIRNTFQRAKLEFRFIGEVPKHYSLDLDLELRHRNYNTEKSLLFNEDVLYLLNIASREFVDVMRSYRFGNYNYLSLNVVQDSTQWVLGRDALELFRRNKIDVQGLLSSFVNL